MTQIFAYPEYKDTELVWNKKLPAHWEVHKGKWLFSKKQRPALEHHETVTCFRDGVVTLRKNRRLSGFTEALKEIGYQGIHKGDFVIHAMDAFAGAIGVSDSEGKCSPVYSVCQPKENINPYYYAHIVRFMAQSNYLLSLATGIRERSTDFRFSTFGNLLLPVPPFEEQQKIVDYLHQETRKINRLILAKRKLIALLREEKQVIINHAVTRGIDTTVPLKPSGVDWLGDIPAHWEIKKVKRLISKLDQGWSPQCHSLPAAISETGVLKVGCVNKDQFSPYQNKVLPPNLTAPVELEIAPGDVLVSRANTKELVGLAAFVESKPYCRLILCDKIFRLSLNIHKVDPQFLVWLIRSNNSRAQIESSTNGASSSMQNISQNVIKNLLVALPSLQEQKEIIFFVYTSTQQIDEALAIAEQEIDLILEYRARLIADVVTGQVDVRSIELDPALLADDPADSLDTLDPLTDEDDLSPDDEEIATDAPD